MRRLMPSRSAWRVMQFDTLRRRLLKLAARVVELKKQVKIHLPSRAPDQAIFTMLLARLPRLVTREPGHVPRSQPPSRSRQRLPDPDLKNRRRRIDLHASATKTGA